LEATFKMAGEREAGMPCPHCRARLLLADEVAACRACGTVHHHRCWTNYHGCGAYACAPPRRELADIGAADKLLISDEDIRKAAPISPIRRATYVAPYRQATLVRAEPVDTSRLAIAALVCAIAGIPLFGLLTGAVAVVLASFALAEINHRGRKGTGLAVAGLLLGLGDVIGWIVGLVLIFGGSTAGPRPTGQQISPADLKSLPAPIAQGMRANVLITARHGLGSGLGSGIIMRLANGTAQILTNRHVVDGDFDSGSNKSSNASALKPVTVEMLGQETEQGQVVWLAPDGMDLAIVSVPCRSPEAAAAHWSASRSTTRIGDPVFAIGNPQAWGWTHTQGAISQFRTWTTGSREMSVIQTSAPINPGNSGGGLYDAGGALIGINTWTSDKRVSEGLSFAISLDALLALSPPPLERTMPPQKGGQP
jgi:hypothetical protein